MNDNKGYTKELGRDERRELRSNHQTSDEEIRSNSMKTFQEFISILIEKKEKKKKQIIRGVVVKPEDPSSYNLNDFPTPVDTEPGSPERLEQIKQILKHGAKRFKK